MEQIDRRGLRRTLNGLVRRMPVQRPLFSDGPSVEDLLCQCLGLVQGCGPEVLVCALGARWRAECMPQLLDWHFKREWDLFLVLEVGFFYPYRHRRSPPSNPGQIGVLLADRELIASVIADGDEGKAASYLLPRHDSFWMSIVPMTEALPYDTVWARIDRAMMRLAALLGDTRHRSVMPIEQRGR